MFFEDFESIFVPEDNRNLNLDESSTNKNPNHGSCSYGHKLVCVDDEFIKTFNLYLGEDAIYILLKVCYKKVSILVM